jgi:hypothetical protein
MTLVRTDVSEEHIASIFGVSRLLNLPSSQQGCAFFAVRREAYHRCELGRFNSLVTPKMEAICSSDALGLTRATRCKISKDIRHGYRRENIPEDSVLRHYLYRLG